MSIEQAPARTAPHSGAARSRSRTLGLAEATAFLETSLRRAAERARIAIVRFPAPCAPIHALAMAARKGTGISWCAPDGSAVIALGACHTIALSGASRFEALEPARRELFEHTDRFIHSATDPSERERPPRLYGGWAFAEGGADEEPWQGFGDGRFFLPRWTYRTDRGRATLTAAVDLRDGWQGRISLATTELATLYDALARPAQEPRHGADVRVADHGKSEHAARIRDLTDAIRAGELSKVVAARRVHVCSAHDLDPDAVLHRLRARYPRTWCFALRFAGGTFVAATPERLFRKRGRVVEADALAGSIASSAPDAEQRLRASAKDLREHTPVVRYLSRQLAPLCEHVAPPAAPQIRRLPNVLHLHTRVEGRLHEAVDVATLARALHPTPAVGGVPAADARAWISAREPHPRGWYCGPVGWVDARGDAEFTVALRCGILRGPSAWLYAGGGIVEGSEPEAEWNESAVKLRPLLQALGAR